MADTARLKFSVSASDEASPTLKKISKEIGDVGKNAGKDIDLGSITDSLSASGIGDMIGGAVGVAGLGVAAASFAAVSWELGKTGAQALRTRDSFLDMTAGAGISASAMLTAMRTATAGTVADSELMLAANRALMLGVVTNAKDAGGLMAAAIERGRALGVSAGQAVSDIITGIGRMSPQILDNLGIVGAADAVEQYAKSLGVTADALTDVQKKQALVNAVIASSSGGAVVDDAAAAFERMDASISNAKEALGIMFAPAVAVIAQQIADAARQVTEVATRDSAPVMLVEEYNALNAQLIRAQENLNQLKQIQEGLPEGFDPKFAPMVAQGYGNQDTTGQNKAKVAALEEEIAAVQRQIAAYRAAHTEIGATGSVYATVAATVTQATSAFADATLKLDALGMVAAGTATDVNTLNSAVGALSAQMAGLAPVFGALQSMRQGAISALESKALAAAALPGADVAAIREQYAAAADEIWNMPLALDANSAAMFDNKMAVNAAAGELGGNYFDSVVAADKATQKLASGSVKDAGQAFNDLKSKVSGVLDQAINVGVDWEGKDKNADGRDLNENARRMAAIANEGLIGQSWLGDMANEAPGAYADLMLKIAEGMDAKSAAQSIMADFQDGLRPDMINQDAVKDRVRRMILGDQATSEMANQIAQELSQELGVSLAEAQSAAGAVLGTKPATDATSLADGLSQATNGKALIQQIATQMEAAAERMRTAGNSAGSVWGIGFMATVENSVATPLINLLVALVTPGVMAAVAAQQSQTEAK